MARVEKKVIDKNSLKFGKDNTEDFFYGLEEVKRICYGRTIKFNRAMYYIEAQDSYQVTAKGEDLSLRLGSQISRKYDLAEEDNIKDVPYQLEGIVIIPPNEDPEREKNGLFTIKQDISDLELTVFWKQSKDEVILDGVFDESMSPWYSQALASGGYISLSLGIKGKKGKQWASGREEHVNWIPFNVSITRIEGEPLVAGATLSRMNGEVYAPNLETTPAPNGRSVAVIRELDVVADGVTLYFRGNLYATQAENIVRDKTSYNAWTYAEPDPLDDDKIAIEGGVVLFHGKATKTITSTWSSGSPAGQTITTLPLYFETNYGTFPNGSKRYTMTDEGSIELTIGSTDADRTIIISVNNADAKYSEEYRYRQSAKEFVGYNHFVGFMEALVGYGQAPAGGGSVAPSVTVYVKMCAEYSDGSYDEDDWIKTKASNVRVTSASTATDEYDGMASLNKSNGVVTVNDLGTTEWKDVHTAFVVNSMSGLFDVGSGVYDRKWPWSGTAVIEQEENIKNYTGEVGYTYEADIQPDTLEGNDTTISVEYEAWQHTYYYWNSRPSNILSDDVAQWLYIRITGAATASKDVKGSGTYTYDVGTVGTTDRTFKVAVTNNSGKVIASRTITQLAPATFHYELARVDDAGVSYEQAFAWANSVSPSIQVRAWFKKVWSNGVVEPDLISEDHRNGESGFTISNADGQAKNDSLATINSSTGVVSVKSLGTNRREKPHDVFEVQSLYGKFKSALTNKSHDWQMTGTAMVEQAMNIPRDISNQNVYRVVDPEDMLSGDTTLYLAYQAENVIKQQWDSDRYGDYINTITTPLSMRIVVGVGYTGEVSVSGSGTATFPVGINSSTTSSRTFRVMAYDSKNNVVANFNVVQAANILSWIAPVINGEFSVSNISAKGGSVTVRIPVKQYKVNTSGTPVEPIYTWWADALAIEGTPSNGGSVSGGTITAPNLGQTTTSERTIFTITGVKIEGWDGNEHVVKVSPSVAVKQNANFSRLERASSNVSISANGNKIPTLGGSVVLTVNAYEETYTYWESAPETPTNRKGYNMTGYVTTNLGTITGSPVSGTGKSVTLAYNVENDNLYDRSIAVSLRAVSSVGLPDITASTSVAQSAAVFTFTKDQNLYGIGPDGGVVTLFFTSIKNGYAWPVTKSAFTTSGLSGVTIGDVVAVNTGGYYKINITVPRNTGAARSFKVNAVQPVTGYSLEWTIDQSTAIERKVAEFKGAFNFGLSLSGGVNYNMVSMARSSVMSAEDTSKFKGGTCSGLTFKLVGTSTGVTYGTREIGDISVPAGGTAALGSYAVTFNNTLGTAAVQIEVWYDGKKQQTVGIMASPSGQSEE